MNLDDIFEYAVKELHERKCKFAVAGGITSSVYRSEVRLTMDADILIYSGSDSQKIAEEILNKINYSVSSATIANLSPAPRMNKKSLPTLIIVGRPKDKGDIGLDFILPDMPWFPKAISRAQDNLIDFGFGKIPCLTIEDFIISKLFAYQLAPKRIKDLDDLTSVFQKKSKLDLSYLCAELERLKIGIPKELYQIAPKALRVLSKRMKISSK